MSAVARDLADPLKPLGRIPGYDAHFIGAINQCLSIFPQQRLPSAAAWRDAIDRERRIKLALEQAARDDELDRRVRALVAEFHRDFVPVEARPAPPPPPPPRAAARSLAHLSDPDALAEAAGDDAAPPAPPEAAPEPALSFPPFTPAPARGLAADDMLFDPIDLDGPGDFDDLDAPDDSGQPDAPAPGAGAAPAAAPGAAPGGGKLFSRYLRRRQDAPGQERGLADDPAWRKA
jgi:hypothetical protein